jgi:hypothetical protein
MFGHVRPCSAVMFGHVRPCSVMFGHVRPCLVMFRSCSAMFGHVRPCSVMFGHVRSCLGHGVTFITFAGPRSNVASHSNCVLRTSSSGQMSKFGQPSCPTLELGTSNKNLSRIAAAHATLCVVCRVKAIYWTRAPRSRGRRARGSRAHEFWGLLLLVNQT